MLTPRLCGALVSTAGLVINRQRPAAANNVTFVTLEDETGQVNLVIFKQLAERERRTLLGARLMGRAARGRRHAPDRQAAHGRLPPARRARLRVVGLPLASVGAYHYSATETAVARHSIAARAGVTMSSSKMRQAGPVSALLLGLAAALPAAAGFVEGWDDPARQNNGFYYFNESASVIGVPMEWRSSGGDPGGFVRLDLANGSQWSAITSMRNHWVAYAYGFYDAAHPVYHPVDFSVDNRLTFSMGAEAGFDLGGAPVTFWLGEWVDPDGETGPTPAQVSFFYLDIGVTPGVDAWADLLIDIDPAGPWVTLTNNQPKTAADLLVNPQQWGLGIFGGSAPPTGVLALDNLRFAPRPANVPLPAPLPLLLAGLGGLVLIRHGAAVRRS
jgi:hypothetical protein